MKRLLLLLLIPALCTSCAALPAEERAFAVALWVGKEAASWQVAGRIPAYQSGGGYLTVTGAGDTLDAALSAMDGSAPMQVTLSQLRLLVLDEVLAATEDLSAALTALSARSDMRQQCAVALTDAPSAGVMAALKPSTGSRLSKSLELLLDTRVEQGSCLSATLAEVMRMGERQSPVLMALMLADGAVNLSGGYALDGDMRLAGRLTPEETALLSLLTGGARMLMLPSGSAKVQDASAKTTLSADLRSARVELTLRTASSNLTAEALERVLADEALALLTRLYGAGCDVLGLGRQAVRRAQDMAHWHAMDWPARLAELRFEVAVRVEGPA